MNVVEALQDPGLFGGVPTFHDLRPWHVWLVFLKAVYGLRLDPMELVTFRKHTGRATYSPQAGGWREAVCIVGRQSGKSRIAALIAAFEAVMASRESDGRNSMRSSVSQDHRASMRERCSAVCRGTIRVRARTFPQRHLEDDGDAHLGLRRGPCRLPLSTGGSPRPPSPRRHLGRAGLYSSRARECRGGDGACPVRHVLATTGGKLLILSSPFAGRRVLPVGPTPPYLGYRRLPHSSFGRRAPRDEPQRFRPTTSSA